MFRYRTPGLIAIGGLALLSGCKHHRSATDIPVTHAPLMTGAMPITDQHAFMSSVPAGIIAGPMPHLLEPGVLPMPDEKKTAHNHPTGLWPSLNDSGKIPAKKAENTTVTTPKTTLTSVPGPASPAPATPAKVEEIDPTLLNGPSLAPRATSASPGTFIAAPNEMISPTPTNIISAPKDTSPVVQLMGLKASERLGHGPNYRWVAGVLDKHQKGGFWTLRYADYSADDAWGGKVRLIEDPRLANFKNGDIVFIEGELLAPAAGSADSSGYPPYKVSQIRTLDSGR